MISEEAQEWFARNRGRVLAACLSPLLACAVVAGLLWAWNESRIQGQRQRIETAVRASFPGFCAAPGEKPAWVPFA